MSEIIQGLRRVRWPDGKRLCVTIGVAFEDFERQSQYHQERVRPGQVDRFSLSYADYGWRVGVWRLLDFFGAQGVPVSFSCNGLAAERHPRVLAAMIDGGHSVVGHGWANDRLLAAFEDEEAERAEIRRTLDAIGEAAGSRPAGWISPGNMGSERTPSLLVSEGVRWCGDDASDDLPYVQNIGGRPLAILPKANLAANDLVQWILPQNSPSVFAETLLDAVTTLDREASADSGGWIDMVLHCHMAGRPAFLPTLARVMERLRELDGVWWAAKDDLAEVALARPMTRDDDVRGAAR
ncbi:polysaccharide deacetylase family protein [Actinomadura scrupuli]|uniref:polysaccharide deacetylase family protein n=1 Tax=Actinomadura scrupuli TaxID=559629 RepID=UPI003D98FECE